MAATSVVRHPRIRTKTRTVRTKDLDRWLAQGWVAVEEPAADTAAASGEEK